MFSLNEQIKTKKPHACGGKEWTVIRVGADFKIKCNKCERIIMVSSDKLKKMIK